MDIILDSNIYLKDPTFRGVQFVELLAYLRATGSHLVVSTLVRDEVCARYREQLQQKIDTSRERWNAVQSMMTDAYPHLPHVDIDTAVTSLMGRLRKPCPEVETILLDLSGVDINEVVARGVNRKRPATLAGEQLRDVILWLSVLHRAEQRLDTVVFISSDSDFQSKDRNGGLSPELQSEIDSLSLPILFYPDIGSFLATVSSARHLEEAMWRETVSDDEIKLETEKRLERIYWGRSPGPVFVIEKVEVDSVVFQGGQTYQVSADTAYAEASYRGTAWVLLTDTLTGGHPHNVSKGEIVDRWWCSFLVQISARIEKGRVAAWQVNKIEELNIPFTDVK
jgi:hypothetical protein